MQTDRPTVIEYDDHEYLFEGFSLFSHTPLTNVSLLRSPGQLCVRPNHCFESEPCLSESEPWLLTTPTGKCQVS